MSAALAAEGENLTKLEKADVLELTVRHLHQLHREGELTLAAAASGLFGNPLHPHRSAASGSSNTAGNPGASVMDRRRYQGGFLACAQQVASYVMKTPGLEPGLGQRLLAHLARCAQQLSDPSPSAMITSGMPVLPESNPPPFVPFPMAHLVPANAEAFANTPREYSITAQFQVYRNLKSPDQAASRAPGAPVPPIPRALTPEVLMATAEEAGRSDSPPNGLKRRASSALDQNFPQIPKKRYAHVKFEQESAHPHLPPASSPDPAAGSSSGVYVVESRILQMAPAGSSAPSAGMAPPADCKEGDSMWRPWWTATPAIDFFSFIGCDFQLQKQNSSQEFYLIYFRLWTGSSIVLLFVLSFHSFSLVLMFNSASSKKKREKISFKNCANYCPSCTCVPGVFQEIALCFHPPAEQNSHVPWCTVRGLSIRSGNQFEIEMISVSSRLRSISFHWSQGCHSPFCSINSFCV